MERLLGADAARKREATRDVIGVGQNSLDRVCFVDALPQPGTKRPLGDYRELPGGQIATAILACARLGLSTAYCGAIGDDAAGAAALAPLEAAGVDLADVKRIPGAPTQLAIVLVERTTAERTILWQRDPRLALAAADLDRSRIESARVLLIDAGDPDLAIWAAGVARAAGVPVVLDADAPGPRLEALLACVDFPIVSRDFAESFSQTRNVCDALGRLCSLGARLAVVTLGELGAVGRIGRVERAGRHADQLLRSPAYRVAARDTTGAGDVFHAAFAWALLEGGDAETVLRAANAAAALSCRAEGAQGGLPSVSELAGFQAEESPGEWRGEAVLNGD